MPLTLESSYLDDGTPWMRGNLHAHSTESDGKRPPQEVVDDYAARGYGFLMLSDHDKLTAPERLEPRGLILIPGNEVSAKGPHLLHINAKTRLEPESDRQAVLDAIAAEGGLAVLNHPNWQEHFNHCPQEFLETWTKYVGIEIYNGVIRRLSGSPLATDRWDRLLSRGRKLWGFANDDSHREDDVELAWNVAQVRERSVAGVVEALAAGRFYASTGVTIERIAVHGRTIHVHAPNAQRLCLVSNFGKRELHADAPSLTFHVPEDAKYTYVRVECYGEGEAMAWTQPVYLRKT